jgi:hypothetical protein
MERVGTRDYALGTKGKNKEFGMRNLTTNPKYEYRNCRSDSHPSGGFPVSNDQNTGQSLSSYVLKIGEFEFRICPSTWLRVVNWSNHFVLALWNSAVRTLRRQDSTGQGFRLSDFDINRSSVRVVVLSAYCLVPSAHGAMRRRAHFTPAGLNGACLNSFPIG